MVLEAMAEGLPLIVTRSGGVPEYVDTAAALFVEREHVVEKLQQAICYMKEHPAARKQMSEAAKIQSRKYNEAAYYQHFVRLIQEIQEEENAESIDYYAGLQCGKVFG